MQHQFHTAVVLAGGLGTRLRSVVQDLPKPMAPVKGRPFLEFVLDECLKFGIKDIVLAVGYKHEVIEAHFKASYKGATIRYSVEETPLGTGGGIRQALSMCTQGPVLILNGDTLFTINFTEFCQCYHAKKADILLALKEMHDFDRYGIIETDAHQRVTAFLEKSYRKHGFINGGVYAVNPHLLDEFPIGINFSFEKDFLEKKIATLQCFGQAMDGYFIDIGIPEDFVRAGIEL